MIKYCTYEITFITEDGKIHEWVLVCPPGWNSNFRYGEYGITSYAYANIGEADSFDGTGPLSTEFFISYLEDELGLTAAK